VALAPDPTGLPPVGAEPMPPTDETR
jgi:hypothetical protein